jgi:hypothetical protein
MFRKRIILDGSSDPPTVLDRLQRECKAAGLSDEDVDGVVSAIREPFQTMIGNGRAVASTGGQFRAIREVVTDTVAITLDARFGAPVGFVLRLCRAFGRRR